MTNKNKRKNRAKVIRIARKAHRITGIALFLFFFIIGITTVLLGWKKDSAGYLLAETERGTSSNLQEWLPLDSLYTKADFVMQQHLGPDQDLEVDRLDVRPDKGIVKVSFKNSYWGLQLDAATGEPLEISLRRSDFIEDLHDGSYLDKVLETEDEIFKLIYTSIMGAALLLFSLTGFWLWYGPKRMKKK